MRRPKKNTNIDRVFWKDLSRAREEYLYNEKQIIVDRILENHLRKNAMVPTKKFVDPTLYLSMVIDNIIEG